MAQKIINHKIFVFPLTSQAVLRRPGGWVWGESGESKTVQCKKYSVAGPCGVTGYLDHLRMLKGAFRDKPNSDVLRGFWGRTL